jgi:hypothetical protein
LTPLTSIPAAEVPDIPDIPDMPLVAAVVLALPAEPDPVEVVVGCLSALAQPAIRVAASTAATHRAAPVART